MAPALSTFVGTVSVAFVLAATTPRARAEEPLQVTMDEAVRLALARNPTYEVAREEIRAAQALVEEARAQSMPTLYGSASYTRLDNDRTFNNTIVDPKGAVGLGATLTLPLVSPRTWALWSHARDNAGVTKASADDTRRTVAVATGHAYLAVFAQKRVLAANLHARDDAKGHYEFAHTRFVQGAGNRLDEVRAAQEVAGDEALVESSRAAIVRAEEALSVLVGADGPIDSAEEPTLPQPPPLPAAIDMAANSRTDVVASDLREVAAGHVRRDTWTDYSPTITATFSPFYQTPPALAQPVTGWQAQVVLTAPFYDGGLRYGLQHERDSLQRQASIAREGTIRQAKSDVRTAFEALRRADIALVQAREASRLATEALGLANLAYTAGATTNLDVIDAERVARDAETQAEIAADTARQARLDMLAAAGRFP